MTRTDILNAIIQKCGYTTYLEIGVQKGVNWNAIKCEHKIGVDPEPQFEDPFISKMTSDEFFAQPMKFQGDGFDLIFIDGLHHADQVLRDFDNARKVISPHGTIVLHDCNPPNEESQRVPRETKEWCGDVWKAWAQIAVQNLGERAAFCIDTDYGVSVYSKHPAFESQQVATTTHLQFINEGIEVDTWDYDLLNEYRTELLNLISVDEWKKIINEL